ncbi:conserved hypothetical protein [Neospora caninum Liverpool]|uniref:Uncharacterized protein n=1 Tax=Neospora caninum (strain Liverpool) TaxID=572307 RepID=F0VAE6_NEOCL|nr:conserved hypothetical protein [Neospora caninum Liverpool]CBZ50635.1 conserved hypothetical protein [Neospora caninum Liverpool]|eukprot:XP_003880668.1 conserved hypothetical protein [Neospora caninum Liverpool]
MVFVGDETKDDTSKPTPPRPALLKPSADKMPSSTGDVETAGPVDKPRGASSGGPSPKPVWLKPSADKMPSSTGDMETAGPVDKASGASSGGPSPKPVWLKPGADKMPSSTGDMETAGPVDKASGASSGGPSPKPVWLKPSADKMPSSTGDVATAGPVDKASGASSGGPSPKPVWLKPSADKMPRSTGDMETAGPVAKPRGASSGGPSAIPVLLKPSADKMPSSTGDVETAGPVDKASGASSGGPSPKPVWLKPSADKMPRSTGDVETAGPVDKPRGASSGGPSAIPVLLKPSADKMPSSTGDMETAGPVDKASGASSGGPSAIPVLLKPSADKMPRSTGDVETAGPVDKASGASSGGPSPKPVWLKPSADKMPRSTGDVETAGPVDRPSGASSGGPPPIPVLLKPSADKGPETGATAPPPKSEGSVRSMAPVEPKEEAGPVQPPSEAPVKNVGPGGSPYQPRKESMELQRQPLSPENTTRSGPQGRARARTQAGDLPALPPPTPEEEAALGGPPEEPPTSRMASQSGEPLAESGSLLPEVSVDGPGEEDIPTPSSDAVAGKSAAAPELAAPLMRRGRPGSNLPVCGPEVSHFERTFQRAYKEALAAVHELDDGPRCITSIIGKIGLPIHRKFPEVRTEVVETVVVSARMRLLVQSTEKTLKAMRSGSMRNSHSESALDVAINLLGTEIAIGDTVKEIGPDNQLQSRTWIVESVAGKRLNCKNGDETRILDVEKAVKTIDSYHATIADLTLTNSWKEVEKNNPSLFKALQKVMWEQGWWTAYTQAKAKGAWGILLKSMEKGEQPTGVLETYHLYKKTSAVQGCMPLSAATAAAESDLLGVVADFGTTPLDDLEKEIDVGEDGPACLAAIDFFFSRKTQGTCATEWRRKVAWPPKIISMTNATALKEFFSQSCESKVPTVVRTALKYEWKTLLMLEDLGASMADVAISLDPQGDPFKQLEMDICVAAWFKRQKAESLQQGFGLDFYNPLLVGSYAITHFRALLSATQAGLKSADSAAIETSEPLSGLFRTLTCKAPYAVPIASFLLQASAFLHVEVEQAKKKQYANAAAVMAQGVFDEKKFDASRKWIRSQVIKFARLFMPGYLDGKNPAANRQHALFPFTKMAVVMWMLGLTDPQNSPVPPPSPKVFFAHLLYNKGKDPVDGMAERIKLDCKKAAVNLPLWISTNIRATPAKVKLEDIRQKLVTGLKFGVSQTGDMHQATKDVENLVQGCKGLLFDFNDPSYRPLFEHHHCMTLQKNAISFLRKLFKGSKKQVPEDQINEVFEFLSQVHLVYSNDDSGRLLKGFAEWKKTRKPYDTERHTLEFNCLWKEKPETQRAMVYAALKQEDPEPGNYPVPPSFDTCPAHAVDPLTTSSPEFAGIPGGHSIYPDLSAFF